jgi:hypothetical protein
MQLSWEAAVQFALIVPMGYLFLLLRTALSQLVALRNNTYTKEETDKMINLNLNPVNVKLTDIKEDITWIRSKLDNGA